MIINGDCYELLKTIESKSVNLIIVDPPYLISRDSNFKTHSDTADKDLVTKYNFSIDFGQWDKEDLNLDLLFSEWYRVLKPGGSLIIFFDIWKCEQLKLFAEKYKFKQPRVGQWQKTNPVPVNSGLNYLSNAIEYFFTFVKGKNPTFNSKYDNGVYKFPICHGNERTKHPTQKPVSLIKALIEKHSNIDDVILDNFAGSGTTAHACILTERKFIMIEKDEAYFNIMKNRLENLSTKYIS